MTPNKKFKPITKPLILQTLRRNPSSHVIYCKQTDRQSLRIRSLCLLEDNSVKHRRQVFILKQHKTPFMLIGGNSKRKNKTSDSSLKEGDDFEEFSLKSGENVFIE